MSVAVIYLSGAIVFFVFIPLAIWLYFKLEEWFG